MAVGWAGYAVDMLDSIGIHVPSDLANPPISDSGSTTGIVNLPAILVVAVTCGLLAFGMRQSARANNSMVVLKMAILILFVIVGAFAISADNWSPFVPSNDGSFGDYGVTRRDPRGRPRLLRLRRLRRRVDRRRRGPRPAEDDPDRPDRDGR